MLADVRVAEAGALISQMVFDAGADWISVLSSASLKTIEVVAGEAFAGAVMCRSSYRRMVHGEARACWQMGIHQVIFHQSRDAEKLKVQAWARKFLDLIRSMSDHGFRVSITGNLHARRSGSI